MRLSVSVRTMDRRQFLRNGLIGAAGVGMISTLDMAAVSAAEPGVGPYGALEGIQPDANGIILPEGFTSRIIATSGDLFQTHLINGTSFQMVHRLSLTEMGDGTTHATVKSLIL